MSGQRPDSAAGVTTEGDIAIVGLDCRFPGAADPAALWQLLLDGRDAISAVPANRWHAEDFHDPAGGPGTINTHSGGFIGDADAFDHEFFGITPHEAEAMDPQQRLLLQASWRAFEDATLDPRAQSGSRTGVYIGVMANEWANLQMSDYAAITPQHGSGNGYFMTANRLSYQLDLTGPSLAVDTACSSSLVAVHLACAALASGECDQALAGGVNLVLTPAVGVFYTQAGLSAPDARCKPFSANADGIVRGEGVAVLVLRRLADAQAAGLPIYAVIKGSAVNSDGRSNGITAPNRWAQQQVIGEACRRAGVEAGAVDFLEAHGTGTVLGDMIEVKALGGLHGRDRAKPCGIGSIKGNLGHTEGAAGVAGIIKVALSLHHGTAAPTRFTDQENPRLRLEHHGLRLLAEPMPLAGPSLAGVSSFGIGGTNAHLVLGTAPVAADAAAGGGGVLTVSADNAQGLERNAQRMARMLKSVPADRFAQVCWTSNRVKSSGRHRLAVVATDPAEAITRLRAGAESGVAAPVRAGWMFTGQGSQFAGMARPLDAVSGSFHRALRTVDAAMTAHLGSSIRELLLDDTAVLDRTELAQPGIFAMEYALAQALADAGVRPAWVIGHSIGEFTAAAVAGVVDLDDACRLVAARGRLMQQLPGGGGMLAVRATPAQLAALLDGERDVAVAAVNGPTDLVLSGDAAALDRIRTALAEQQVVSKPLTVSHAFHSPLMAPMLEEFAVLARDCTYRAPALPIYSTVRGRLLDPAETMDAEYWVEHVRATVLFGDALAAAAETDPTHVIEIGPRRMLTPLVGRLRPDLLPRCLTPSPGPGATGRELAETVAALHRDGLDPDWDHLYDPEQRVRRRLPVYDFSTEHRFWLEPTTLTTPSTPAEDTTMDQMIALFREQNALLASLAPGATATRTPGATTALAPGATATLVPGAAATMVPGGAATLVPSGAATMVPGAAATLASGGAATGGSPQAVPAVDPGVIAGIVHGECGRVSGYAADRLRDTETLTGELGFDSMMLADLFGGLMRKLPGLRIDPSWPSAATTLGDVVGYVTGQVAGTPAPAPTAPVPAPTVPVSAPAVPAPAPNVPVAAPAVQAPAPVVPETPAVAVTPEYRIADFPEVRAIADRLTGAAALGLDNPYFLVNDGVTRDTSLIDGVPVVNFSSYNYLGLSGHPAVVAAVQDAVARYGSSCSASRVLSGEKPVHRELEAEIAALLGTEDAIALVGGHSTNVTIIGHLVGPEDLVIHDSLAHDSILQGCVLSGATRRPFPHNDTAALDRLLGELRPRYRRVLILIEGVYSQDGDIPDLPAIIEIKKKHRALLMIDEAHSIGVLGAHGGGIGEYFDIDRADVELWSGTMSKALAGCGGYVAGSADLIRFLKYTTPGFVYSVGMTPMNAAASAEAIRQLRADGTALERLRHNARLFLELARAAGIDTGDSHDTPIIPCIVGDSLQTMRLSNTLLTRGINVNPIIYPAVPEDFARLRFFITACHTEEQIRDSVAILAEELGSTPMSSSPAAPSSLPAPRPARIR
ncbi:aminotransferase class I/II-fold pyridoxal phosphate-dependent enzyme [Nocardia sp. NPDC059177]|uniref:aminotransferase class I/II-fold pyridoxal phosphate-dependent enzyme n=1 Tax=Nocardia sp. NPDC059177 TaxID=3346759 RepID=UPI0036963AEC